jgi:hypothetical protein
VLGASTIDHVIREVVPGIRAINLDAHEATRALVGRVLGSRVTSRVLRSGPIRAFLDAAPGVVEVATLDRIRSFVDETDFDPILVDGDATGHTRMLFALHGVLGSLGVSGAIAALLDRTSGIFADADVAAVHLAALPTRLAIEETVELWTEMRRAGHVALGRVLLDRVEGRDARDLDAAEIDGAIARAEPAMASALALLRVDRERWRRADAMVAHLETVGARVVRVDESAGLLDLAALRAIGESMLDAEAR